MFSKAAGRLGLTVILTLTLTLNPYPNSYVNMRELQHLRAHGDTLPWCVALVGLGLG